MILNLEACEVSFDLDSAVEVRGEDGGPELAKTVTFSQPTRKTAPIFQNLVAKYNRALTATFAEMAKYAGEEGKKQIQEEAEKAQQEAPKSLEAHTETITVDDIELKVEGFLDMMGTMDFDFEEGFALFDRLILSGGVRSTVCRIGNARLTESILDMVNYQDYYKMLAVYLAFFEKPVKSGTKKESEMPSNSATPVTEV